ncbi:hypothetical protein RNZ50_10485 [Paracoccaceae bacterium Fryx2]|nr:hypothetical protein [Paracoccaceae bacterium Fryx2]
MADGKTLNAKNLQRLGAERLATLLLAVATTAAAKRQLRVALSASFGPPEAAREIRKRLAAIRQGSGKLTARRTAALVAELGAHWTACHDLIAPDAPALAFDLAFEMMALAAPVARRAAGDDAMQALFARILPALPDLTQRAGTSPDTLADAVAGLLEQGAGALHAGLIDAAAPALGPEGLALLQRRLRDLRAAAGQAHARHLDAGLRAISDLTDDPDAYAATLTPADRLHPDLGLALARRLHAAGRLPEAHAALAAVEATRPRGLPVAFVLLKADILAGQGDLAAAQALRWASATRALSAEALRAYLKPLPDFDDMEAEDKALDLVAAHPDLTAALAFLLAWPAPGRAAALVLARHAALDGDRYAELSPAAEALADRHPLAATLILRAMIGFALTHARSGRYKHAARHLATCDRLAAMIGPGDLSPDHAAYVAHLRAQHGRKHAFWAAVTG